MKRRWQPFLIITIYFFWKIAKGKFPRKIIAIIEKYVHDYEKIRWSFDETSLKLRWRHFRCFVWVLTCRLDLEPLWWRSSDPSLDSWWTSPSAWGSSGSARGKPWKTRPSGRARRQRRANRGDRAQHTRPKNVAKYPYFPYPWCYSTGRK